jgi:hypothetical protein
MKAMMETTNFFQALVDLSNLRGVLRIQRAPHFLHIPVHLRLEQEAM